MFISNPLKIISPVDIWGKNECSYWRIYPVQRVYPPELYNIRKDLVY
jgi:hypothetical protein